MDTAPPGKSTGREIVDWSKGDHWLGIAGNYTPSGVFSVKGTKEVAYAVFNALTDPANGGYDRIRHAPRRGDEPETGAQPFPVESNPGSA
jgi:hypothetical protein